MTIFVRNIQSMFPTPSVTLVDSLIIKSRKSPPFKYSVTMYKLFSFGKKHIQYNLKHLDV